MDFENRLRKLVLSLKIYLHIFFKKVLLQQELDIAQLRIQNQKTVEPGEVKASLERKIQGLTGEISKL